MLPGMSTTFSSAHAALTESARRTPHVIPASLLLLVAVLVFWRIGQSDLREWDESRNGVTAYEMARSGDFVNYTYGGELDTWSAKPPLMIWLVVLAYNVFGFNEFALRLPSAIAIILFFLYAYRLIALLAGRRQALLACLVLISSKAALGEHIGLTGDFDALLLLFLTASAWHFVLFIDHAKARSAYLCAVFIGLAFLTKGTAAFVFLPGMVLYAIVRGRTRALLADRRVWIAAGIVALFVIFWSSLVLVYGKASGQSYYGSSNALETMLVHDTFRRMTSGDFGEIAKHDPLFFVKVLDTRMNGWNYFFIASVIAGGVGLYRSRRALGAYLRGNERNAVVFSVCLIFPMIIALSFAANQHNWYLAPTFLFVAFLTVRGMHALQERWKAFAWIFAVVLFFTFVRNVVAIGT